MGYTTEFKGELKFTQDLTGPQLAYLNTILGEDCRDHPEWQDCIQEVMKDESYKTLYHVDLELTDNFDGVKWSGREKTYDLEHIVTLVTRLMRSRYPDFELTGQLQAQGEEYDDRWILSAEDGRGVKRMLAIVGTVITCPNCEHKFILEENSK